MSEGSGGNIGCRDKTSSWYQKCITFVHVIATAVVPVALYSNMGVALRQFVLYWNTQGIGLSFINTAAADTCVSCRFAHMYLG